MSGANKHPYHLVEASPWPAVGAAAAFTAAIGGVMYMHEVAHGVAVLGLDARAVPGRCAMSARQQPKTADDMVRMRKGRNRAILGAIAGLAVLFFVLTIVRMGGATG